MDLKNFAETYLKIEEKALDIINIYGLQGYYLDGIEVETYDTEEGNKNSITIKASLYYSGGGHENEWLTFDLDEMNNDMEYFKNKYKEAKEKKEAAKKLRQEKDAHERRRQKEERDEAEYKRLKLKFETNSNEEKI